MILLRCMQAIDEFNERVGVAVSWLTTVLVLVVCFDVLTRYVFNFSLVWVQELEWHVFSLIFLFGAAYTLKHDQHVRVDLFYDGRSPKAKAAVNLFGTLVFLLPFCLVLIWGSQDFVINSFNVREISANPGGLPARYFLKACIPIAALLLLMQGISLAIRSWLTIVGKLPEAHHDEQPDEVR